MNPYKTKSRLAVSALFASALLAGGQAVAQAVNYPVGAVVQSLEEDPGSALARHLRDLNTSPRSLTSLLGAGNAALQVGDPRTALSLFARAEEVAPRDGRVKAGMGSAFVQTEQAQAALKFFAEAASMGAPVSSFAKDRGLAFDMIGDNVRAQADYAIALQYGQDPEVERRLALSRAITGDREGALAVLARQVSRGDRAGYRARAFVLALTGDAAGASQAVRAVMPAQAAAMQPFLARLPDLGPADQAMAVHFGRFPQGQAYAPPRAAYAQNQTVPATSQERPDTSQQALGGRSPVQVAQAQQPQTKARTSSRRSRRAAASEPVQIKAQPLPAPAQVAQAQPQIVQPVQPEYQPPYDPRVTAREVPSGFSASPIVAPAPAVEEVQLAQLPPSAAAIDQPAPEVVAEPATAEPVPAESQTVSNFDFNDVVSAVQSLPGATSAPAAAEEPAQVAEASKPTSRKPAAKPAEQKKPVPAKPEEPRRVWVQLAAAQDKGAFPGEFKRLKSKATKLLSDKSAWTAPLGKTNRLLVGPFKTEQEARELVNQLSKVEIASYSWVSEAGQKIDKLPAK